MYKLNILDKKLIKITISRLCQQLIENHQDFRDTVILGIQPRGAFLAARIQKELKLLTGLTIPLGKLDITFHRDDYRRREFAASSYPMDIPFVIENKNVILIDDVLYTGRTIKAALEAMAAFGRPTTVELLVLINRKYSRELPISANYVGKSVNSLASEKVIVELKESENKEDGVWLIQQ
ncbi:MAG: bifunctional pyr operon transcriptional regulator/uracil phosphoribosyltransferase PyrR [Bacteroidota bacterium]|jgi:pyrimidine operon attenuation protein/uracil phosphoribosyltransferase